MTDKPLIIDEVHVWPNLDEAAQAIAEIRAAQDRALLARLTAEGKVLRKGPETALTRAMRPQPHAGINLGIRPKKRKGKR